MNSTHHSDQSLVEGLNNLSLEELVNVYQKDQQRKQKQCEYQKNYMERKKKEFAGLELQIQQLQDQNQKLLSYYQLFELLKLQNPQLADQLINQLRFQNSAPQVKLPTHINTPTPLGSQYSSAFSPAFPMVSLKK